MLRSMARRPFSGECSVLTGKDLPTRGEKVFVAELAQYLGVDGQVIHDLGRQRRLIKRTYRHPGRAKVYYLSLYGASVVMTAVRRAQGRQAMLKPELNVKISLPAPTSSQHPTVTTTYETRELDE